MPELSWGIYHGSKSTEIRAEEFVNSLIENDPTQNTTWREFKIASTLFFENNKTFKSHMRQAFRKALDEIGKNLQDSTNVELNLQKLARCLKLLPLAGIKSNQTYSIPTEVSEKWENVLYAVTPIELTPTSGYGRLVLKDHDRLFAYGLAPLNKPKGQAPIHLIFVDQYPGQQGWLSSLYLRFKYLPSFFSACQEKIKDWIDKHSAKVEHSTATTPNTIIHGLGHAGRLALESMFVPEIQGHIKHVDALNVYTTSHLAYQESYLEQRNNSKMQSEPTVSVQLHKNHYNIWEFMTGCTVKESSGLILQAKEFTKDTWHNIILGTVLSGLLNTLLSSSQYVFIPLIRAVRDHIVELVLLSILTMVFLMLPGLIMTDIGTFLAVFTALYFAAQLVQPFKVVLGWNERTEAECHKSDPQELQIENDETRARVEELSERIDELKRQDSKISMT